MVCDSYTTYSGESHSIDTLMEARWSLYQEEIMTKAEAEKKFGVRIVG